jgi:hypothetical protein
MSRFSRALAMSGVYDSMGSIGMPAQRMDAYSLDVGSGSKWTHASLATGTVVIQAAAPSGDTVIAFNGATSPIGIVSFWLSSVSCLIQQSGRTADILTTLLAGKTYYAASGGGVSTAGTYSLGVAPNSTALYLSIPEFRGAVGQISYLDDLTDAIITSPAANDILSYNATSSAFVNTASPTLPALNVSGLATLLGNVSVGTASTNTLTLVCRLLPRTVNDGGMDASAGATGEIAYNTADNKFYGCVAGSTVAATWAAFH